MLTAIAVFVSGGGTNLQALIDAEHKGILKNGEIRLVVSDNKDAYALERARNNGIEAVVVRKKKAGTQTEYEDRLISLLHEKKIFTGGVSNSLVAHGRKIKLLQFIYIIDLNKAVFPWGTGCINAVLDPVCRRTSIINNDDIIFDIVITGCFNY